MYAWPVMEHVYYIYLCFQIVNILLNCCSIINLSCSGYIWKGFWRAGKRWNLRLRMHWRRTDQTWCPGQEDSRLWVLHGEIRLTKVEYLQNIKNVSTGLKLQFVIMSAVFAKRLAIFWSWIEQKCVSLQGFGRANHAVTTEKLKARYPDYEVTWDNEGYWTDHRTDGALNVSPQEKWQQVTED